MVSPSCNMLVVKTLFHSRCYDPHLLGRLGGVEVEVDDRGEQPRAEQQQQRLQQTSLQGAAQIV